MSGIIAEVLTIANKVDNYAIDATGGGPTTTTYWTDTTHYRATVPAGRRWFLLWMNINRAVSATLKVKLYSAADEIIGELEDGAAATGISNYPNTVSSTHTINIGALIILDENEYIEALFGVAQNASSYASCSVLEIEI